MCTAEVRERDPNLYRASRDYFSGFQSAAEFAGVPFEPINRHWTDARFEKELREWIEQHGPLHYYTMRQTAHNLTRAVELHYGTPEHAAKAFDLPYVRGPKKGK